MRIKRTLDDLFGNPNNVKVLRHMILYPSPVITGRGIARELGMSHATCIRSLNSLVNTGFLTRKSVGSSATYEVATDSIMYTDILEPAFRAEAALLQRLVDTLLVGIRGKVLSVYLFGSVARDKDSLSSDVDMLVLTRSSDDRGAVEAALEVNKEKAYRLFRLGVSTVVYHREEFERMRSKKSPLAEEIASDGVLLAGTEVLQLVKAYRTKKASGSQGRQFKNKAFQYRKAMHLAYDSGLWDAAVSNAVHALILMANALTARESGEYYADKDHAQAPQYLKEVLGPVASKAKEQMAQVLNMKGLVEYEARGSTQKDASGAVKRVDRFFSWAEELLP